MKKLFLIVLAVFIILPCSSAFSFELFDGRLTDGKARLQQTLMLRTHQDDRNIQVTSFRTMARIEGLFDVSESENSAFKIFGFFEYWEDYATHIDGSLKRSIRQEGGGGRGLQEFYRSNDEQEIIKELYGDLELGDRWNLRLGKQIVNWGETSESRVADTINPLNVTNLIGYPDWEDYKIGLWMGRLFFTPENLWSDISFELIVIPYYFTNTLVPPGGSGFFIGKPIGNYNDLIFAWDHDTPDDGWDNTEFGGKIRGMTGVTDWTLSVFYTRIDGPPVLEVKKGEWTYPFYTSYAATFARPVEFIGSILSGEVVLNAGKAYQSGGGPTTDIKDRDVFISAIGLDKNIQIPWLSRINKGVSLISNITWYHYKVLDHDKGISWESGQPGSSWDKISTKLQTSFFNHTLLTGISATYDCTTGGSDFVARLLYFPVDHWFYEISYQQLNESEKYTQGNSNVGNQVIFNIRYEF